MKEPTQGTNWFFVDESGDPTFYNRRGRLCVGEQGCSKILLLGFIETTQPELIRRQVMELHDQVRADPRLQSIATISRTNVCFHATDDASRVRRVVYECIAGMAFKAQFVVARKRENTFQNRFQGKEQSFYDELITKLFENALHRHTDNNVYFAKRSTRKRQVPLQQAIGRAIQTFEDRWGANVNTHNVILSQTPQSETCLQVIDYMNWAVYQAFVNRDMRFYRMVESRVSFLLDVYDTLNYPRNYYNRNNPFDIEKTSPL